MPEEDAAGEIEEVGKNCQIKAVPSNSGVSGMTWEPYEVILMKNGKEYKHIAFDEKGIATWKKESDVVALVRYQMQISEQKGGGFNGDYDPNLTDTDQIALYKYLTLAEQAGWSLTDSYITGQYAKIAEQSALIADCLETILNDAGFQNMVNELNLYKQRDQVLATIPALRAVAEGLTGPNTTFSNPKDPGYTSLISTLLVGINYDKKTKEHQCMIERYEK